MSTARAAAVLALCALLTGCGGIDQGTVTAKGYDAPTTFYKQQCLPIGNNPCGSFVMIPNEVAECWRLDLHDGDASGSVCLDQRTWDTVRVGDHWGGPR